MPYRERILVWLKEDDYSAVWMHERLVVQGYRGSVRTVERFVRREGKKLSRKAYLRFEPSRVAGPS